MAGKVFSITDFRHGLDTRRSEISAPTGTLRILENAVINQGGEIEKRLAFVNSTTLPAPYSIIHGHADTLHAFGVGSAPAIPAGSLAVPIVGHALAAPSGDTIIRLADVEAYNDKFQVTGIGSKQWYTWYDGVLVQQDGAPAGGTYSRTYKTKMYRTYGGNLYFSGVGDPSVTDPASTAHPGAGFINLAINDPEGEGVNGMEVFYNSMAVFARLTTQIWNLDPDPTKDTLSQVLRIGAVGPFTIAQFGTGDVFFLSDSGVRSLKALTISLAAAVSDVGSAIDLILVPAMRASANTFWAQATVQPIQGRYWMALDDTIYVLSYFASSDITAWSTFKPGFNVQSFGVVGNRVFALDANRNVWAYGGADLNTYDSTMQVTVRTPHHSAEEPTTNKRIKSIDVICTGAWSVSIGMLPNKTDQFELCANIQDNTLGLMSIPFAGYGTHFGVQMEHTGPGPATISAIHFNVQEGVVK